MSAKILIIDDSAEDLETYEKWLRDSGHQVVTTQDPACTALIVAERPDIILVDVRMPGLQGDLVCAILSNSSDLARHTKLLLFSNFERETLAELARGANAHGFIRKSSDRDEFLSMLSLWT